MNRRRLLTGLICAPAIVRIDNIMPVKAFKPITLAEWTSYMSRFNWDPNLISPNTIFDDLVYTTIPTRLRVRLPNKTWRMLNGGRPISDPS